MLRRDEAIGPSALRPTDSDPTRLVRHLAGLDRVVGKVVARRVDVANGAEWGSIPAAIGSRVDQIALLAGKRSTAGLGFEEILTQLRANELEQIAQMPDQRVVVEHIVGRAQISPADEGQRHPDNQQPQESVPEHADDQRHCDQRGRQQIKKLAIHNGSVRR